ncbi:hypothetical protein DFJ69_1828 [Thermomonospora umbrina]|uniref:Uncharacterized protein n=1 Tax=Thermomonospora umbrina TaxID=111806 RepID=A0A3D9STT6_9ACTN|nr:hypothetical protein DFJ69_1828 [Thermomonospora umbrina]
MRASPVPGNAGSADFGGGVTRSGGDRRTLGGTADAKTVHRGDAARAMGTADAEVANAGWDGERAVRTTNAGWNEERRVGTANAGWNGGCGDRTQGRRRTHKGDAARAVGTADAETAKRAGTAERGGGRRTQGDAARAGNDERGWGRRTWAGTANVGGNGERAVEGRTCDADDERGVPTTYVGCGRRTRVGTANAACRRRTSVGTAKGGPVGGGRPGALLGGTRVRSPCRRRRRAWPGPGSSPASRR